MSPSSVYVAHLVVVVGGVRVGRWTKGSAMTSASVRARACLRFTLSYFKPTPRSHPN